MAAAEQLSAVFAALADPTRRAILLRLVDGDATVNELAEPFTISQPAISRHLKVLEKAGLIDRRVEGTKRPCRLAAGGLDHLHDYLQLLRDALEANYGRLDRLLGEMESSNSRSKVPKRTKGKSKS